MDWRSWLRKELEIIKDAEVHMKASPAPAPLPPLDGGMNATAMLNPRSETWLFATNWAQTRMQKARERNDSVGLDLAETSVARGEIKILKELLALDKPKFQEPERGDSAED